VREAAGSNPVFPTNLAKLIYSQYIGKLTYMKIMIRLLISLGGSVIKLCKRVAKTLNKSVKLIFRIFEASMIIKGVDGILQIIGSGILFYVSRPDRLDKTLLFFTQHEFSQDPHDFVSYHIALYIEHLSTSTINFGAVYLLVHGLLKIFIVTMVLQKRLWAYPVAISALVIFASYQIYRYTDTHSIFLLFFSIFDLIAAMLTSFVYQKLKIKHGPLSKIKIFVTT
jgi:uncharacterized membrane protein